jgi:hypothetical protein
MVKLYLELGEKQNKIVNFIKKQQRIEDNSEAINYIISKYKEDCIDLEVNPEYIDKLLEIDQEPGIKFKTINELRQIIEGD